MSDKPKSQLSESIAKIASREDDVPPIIMRFLLQSCARELLPGERVADCMRTIAPMQSRVEIHKHQEAKRAYYKNLVICSRLWHCPVCASRITEERRKELHHATMLWTGGLVLATYTASHTTRTSLREFLNSILESYRAFKSGIKFQEIQEHYGWTGSVRSLEITYGKNGWHPHIHELIFLTNTLNAEQVGLMEFAIKIRWQDMAKRNSIHANFSNGFKLADASHDIKTYVTKFGEELSVSKWTPSHEITKQPVKLGKAGGRTPAQLLMDYAHGDKQAGVLWREYALTLKGRNQLVWSRGLRALFKMPAEKTDAEIAEEIPQPSTLIASLTRGQWRIVLDNLARGELLHKAGYMNEADFVMWLTNKLDTWMRGDI